MELVSLIPSRQLWLALVLMAALFAIVRSLLHKSGDRLSAISLDDIILEWDPRAGRDRVSIIRLLAIGAFSFTVWEMVSLTMNDKMTEGYMTIFNVTWVGPLLAQIVWGKKPPLPTEPPPEVKP